MMGQTVLVTGATSGIGFFTAQRLAAMGARVLITGREPERGEKALQEIRRAAGHSRLAFLAADHETVGGNRRLAQRVRGQHHRLDVLVDNVGGLSASRRETADGYEATLAVTGRGAGTEPILTLALTPGLGHRASVLSAQGPARKPRRPRRGR